MVETEALHIGDSGNIVAIISIGKRDTKDAIETAIESRKRGIVILTPMSS